MPLSHIVYLILAPILSVTGTALNLVTCYIFRKKIQLEPFSNILMTSIAICDILSCIFSNSVYFINIIIDDSPWNLGIVTCKVFRFSTMLICVSQIWTLVALNIDRKHRLLNPDSTQSNKYHAALALGIIWLCSCILTLPRIFQFGDHQNIAAVNATHICKPTEFSPEAGTALTCILFVLGYGIPFALILYVTVRIQVYLHYKEKQIHPLLFQNFHMRKQKVTLSLNLTGLAFLFTWSPFFILSILDIDHNILFKKQLVDMNFSLRCSILMIGSLKPIIYIITMEKFREALSELICIFRVRKKEVGNKEQRVNHISSGSCYDSKFNDINLTINGSSINGKKENQNNENETLPSAENGMDETIV